MPNTTPELALAQRLTIAQVAALANCHPRTVRRAIAAGRLAAFRLDSGRGGRAAVRLRLADVERWLDGDPRPEAPAADARGHLHPAAPAAPVEAVVVKTVERGAPKLEIRGGGGIRTP